MTSMPDPSASSGQALAVLLQERLSPALLAALRRAADLATARGRSLYLVGGVIRDILLRRSHLDADLTVVGDAGALAEALAEDLGGHAIVHHQFGTARVTWDNLSLDLATARSESYPRPGALPVVRPSDLRDDLLRRDFSINALAVRLDGPRWGELIDLAGGLDDLQAGLVRVLHPRSFQDDPTRMFRAVRYEQRLGFRLEPATEALLRRDLGFMQQVTADRLRREIELILREERPETALLRAQELGLLAALYPVLQMTEVTAAAFAAAREAMPPEQPSSARYWCLLAYDLRPDDRSAFATRLNLPSEETAALSDLGRVQDALPALAAPGTSPSMVASLLESPKAPGDAPLLAVAMRAASDMARRRIRCYRQRWRGLRPILSGNDLLRLGIPRGPLLGTVLQRLRWARLDGVTQTREDEVRLVQEWLPALAGQENGSAHGP